MHRHFCEIAGHDWQCSDNCDCICGLPMNGNEHTDCPIELRPCLEHDPEQEARILEAMSDGGALPETVFDDRQGHCQCVCAYADIGEVVGRCLWCDHVYTEFTAYIQDEHFAHHCLEAPLQMKEAALASLAKRNEK